MGEIWIDSLTDTSCPVVLHPEFEFQARERAIRATHRTIGGVQMVYDWAEYKAYTIPLNFVNSADAFRMNQWWRDNDILALWLDTSQDLRTVEGRLTNQEVPLGQFNEPYVDLHKGVLMFEATAADSYVKTPFVLDDALRGLLDANHNPIR